jgi:fluoride exporter
MMTSYLLVGAGGALGAMARFGLARVLEPLSGTIWPIAVVNLVGSALLGALVFGHAEDAGISQPWRLFLGTGLLGGFTTFSAFAAGTLELGQTNGLAVSAAFVLVNVMGCVLAAFVGGWLMRAILS